MRPRLLLAPAGFVILVSCCAPQGHGPAAAPTGVSETGPGRISVLISRVSGAPSVSVAIEGACRVRTGGDEFVEWTPGGTAEFRLEGGAIADPEGRRAAAVTLTMLHGFARCGGRKYPCSIALSPDDSGGIRVVCTLGVEEYIEGVVGSEMPASWPIEALKAQAVAARSYAVSRRSAARAKGAAFDVYDDTRSQVYSGSPEGAFAGKIRQAVQETSGEALVYGGRLLQTFFHSTCGGRTEPGSAVFGVASCPALGGSECGFCADSPSYAWEARFDAAQAAEKLGLAQATAFRGIGPGPSGRFLEVEIETGTGTVTMKSSELRRRLGNSVLKSSAFTVEAAGQEFVFRGKGFGHGVGLCQWGARGMAAAGHGYAQILERYYPGAVLMQAAAVASE